CCSSVLLRAFSYFFLVYVRRRLPRSSLFPYTTLFRSLRPGVVQRPRSAAQPQTAAQEARDRRDPARARARRPDLRADQAVLQGRSEEHTSELQSRFDLVCRLLLEKKKTKKTTLHHARH